MTDDLAGEIMRLVEKVGDHASAELDAAVRAASAAAESEAEGRLSAEIDRTRRAAEAEIERAKRAADAEVDHARRAAERDNQALLSAEIDRHKRATEAESQARLTEEVDRVRADDTRQLNLEIAKVRAEAGAALVAEVARVRAELGGELARVRAEHDGARSRFDSQLSADIDRARAEERQSRLTGTERLLHGIRRLDEAGALSEVLEALVASSADYAGRVAMLVVHGGGLRGWRFIGFDAEVSDRQGTEIHEPDHGAIVRALRSGEAALAQPHAGGASAASFAPLPLGRVGLAVPVRVGGRVVAIVYADDATSGERPSPSAWPEVIEVFARHAGRCLESLTALRSVQAAAR